MENKKKSELILHSLYTILNQNKPSYIGFGVRTVAMGTGWLHWSNLD